jgi:uncharacterized protein (TIGR03437 family)
MKRTCSVLFLLTASVFPALAQSGTGTCTTASLSGTYGITLTARQLNSTGSLVAVAHSAGTAVFDGQSAVNIALMSNSNTLGVGQKQTLSGTYNVTANCTGIAIFGAVSPTTFDLVIFDQGKTLALAGTDGKSVYNGNGNIQPSACVLSTLSGAYVFSGTGFGYSTGAGTPVNAGNDLAGLLQFDGQGNVTGTWTVSASASSTPVTASGTVTMTGCTGAITITDASKTTYSFFITVTTAAGNDFDVAGGSSSSAASQTIFAGSAHSPFVNPGLAVVDAASNASGGTPPGSIFTVYGSALATKEAQPGNIPLPTTVLTTTVTINGEPAPIFYENPTQINAQMPEDVKPGLATVIVKNGSSTSNAVAVAIPAGASPGIFIYGQNRAVAVNQDGSVNSPTAPAHVGDVMVAYFTGGGPVQAAGQLVTGARTPQGLSPVSGTQSVKVGTVDAAIAYMGLTPGSIGLYQVNFTVPQVAKGDRPLVIAIGGQSSNAPLMAVAGN